MTLKHNWSTVQYKVKIWEGSKYEVYIDNIKTQSIVKYILVQSKHIKQLLLLTATYIGSWTAWNHVFLHNSFVQELYMFLNAINISL